MSLWIRSVSILLPCALLMGGGLAFYNGSRSQAYFPLKVIEVQNPLQRVSVEELETAVKEHMSLGFFGLNVAAVQASLKALPWVEEASIRRVFPDRILISVKEKTAQARWREDAALSTEGVVFYPDLKSLPPKLPKFIGSNLHAKEMIQQYLKFLEVLGPLNLQIAVLELSPRGAFKITLDNGIAILLGKTGLEERLGRFMLAYQKQLKSQTERMAYVDLRYTTGLAIGWKTEAPLQDEAQKTR